MTLDERVPITLGDKLIVRSLWKETEKVDPELL